MYVEVYIFGMEMSQRICLWYQILNVDFFWENVEKSPFFQKNYLTGYKNNFEFKMLRLLANHVKTQI